MGYLVGYDLENHLTMELKSKVKKTREEAQVLCDRWTRDIEIGLIPDWEVL